MLFNSVDVGCSHQLVDLIPGGAHKTTHAALEAALENMHGTGVLAGEPVALRIEEV